MHANATFAEWLGTTLEKLIGGGKRLQEYLAEDSQGGGAPWRLLPTQEAIGCAKVDFVAGDGRQFDAAPVGIALLDTIGVVTDCSVVFA